MGGTIDFYTAHVEHGGSIADALQPWMRPVPDAMPTSDQVSLVVDMIKKMTGRAAPLPDDQATPNARVLADYASSLAGESGAIELLTEALRVMRHRMGKP